MATEAIYRLAQNEPARKPCGSQYWAPDDWTADVVAAPLHGGIGVDVGYPLHRYLWAKHELAFGSAPAHLAKIGAGLAA
jgi:hypothetical protein